MNDKYTYIIDGDWFILSPIKNPTCVFLDGFFRTKKGKKLKRGIEYHGNGTPLDAIKLKEICLNLKGYKPTETLMIDFFLSKGISIQTLKSLRVHNFNRPILEDAIGRLDFIRRARDYVIKMPGLSDLLSDKIIEDWYIEQKYRTLNLLSQDDDLNKIGLHVFNDEVEFLLK